ncbi:zinc finger protein [Macleaya cordata]|uniref:Zinc finger protein n=1 Tax=Macleaya cordata TaxID=56857 RepID=A0A200Q1Y7_MACCD|nr:zinc finger protein [Macleaya cordata]
MLKPKALITTLIHDNVGKSGIGFSLSGPTSTQSSTSFAFGASSTPSVCDGSTSLAKLESLSAMPSYKDRSHEELRWEDYQLGDKGGCSPAGQSAGGIGFNASTPNWNPFGAQATTPDFGSTGFWDSAFVEQHGGSRVKAYTPTAEDDSWLFFDFCRTPSPLEVLSSSFGVQATTATSGSTDFGKQQRVVAYTPTPEVDGGNGTQPAENLQSISAMPFYKDKSHEELRWEDYQLGDKGGPNLAGQSAAWIGFDAPTQHWNPFVAQATTPISGSTGFGQSAFGGQCGGTRARAYTHTAEVDRIPFVDTSLLGVQTTTPTAGSTSFGGQCGGSRAAAYTPTAEVDGCSGIQPAVKLESISAMPFYVVKSHEELRWEDYQLGDQGGLKLVGQSAGGIDVGATTLYRNPLVRRGEATESRSKKGEATESSWQPTKGSNCCICYEMEVDSLLYRCGHICACFKCAKALQRSSRKCPICRAPITDSSSSSSGSSVFGEIKDSTNVTSRGSSVVGPTRSQLSLFGNIFQQTQPTVGSNLLGSVTLLDASSQPGFGASSTPALGSSFSGFGASSTPSISLGSTPSATGFGASFSFPPVSLGSTPPAAGLDALSQPAFGTATSTPALGSSFTGFDASSTPSISLPSTPSSATGFGASFSFPPVSLRSTPPDTGLGASSTPLSAASSVQLHLPWETKVILLTDDFLFFVFPDYPAGATQVTAPTDINGRSVAQPAAGKLGSISAMPVYGDKRHEELRWEDYLLGDYGCTVSGKKAGFEFFGPTCIQSSPFGSTFEQTQPAIGSSLFGSSTPFGASSQPASGKKAGFELFGPTRSQSSPFGSTFGQTQPAIGSGLFGSSTPFGASSQPALGSTMNIAFGQSSTPGCVFSTPSFGFGSTPAFGGSTSAFDWRPSVITSSPFGRQCGGSRVAVYTPTTEVDGGRGGPDPAPKSAGMAKISGAGIRLPLMRWGWKRKLHIRRGWGGNVITFPTLKPPIIYKLQECVACAKMG